MNATQDYLTSTQPRTLRKDARLSRVTHCRERESERERERVRERERTEQGGQREGENEGTTTIIERATEL